LQVLVVERHDLPKVSVQLRLKLGAAHNPAGKEGLALLTLSSIKRGTGTRTGEQIAREFANMAALPQASADWDSMSTGFDVLKKDLKPAFRLLADTVLNPLFGEKSFQSEKKEWL